MLRTLALEYRHLHIGVGLFGNLCFVAGSVLFFKRFEAWQTFAVWLFVVGSAGMLISSVGEAINAAVETGPRREGASGRDASGGA